MENSKPSTLKDAQNLQAEQQVMEWLDDMGISFATPAERKPPLSSVKKNREDAA